MTRSSFQIHHGTTAIVTAGVIPTGIAAMTRSDGATIQKLDPGESLVDHNR